ncbi:ribokinase [Terribacillus sp. DMT04]|uniref:ribokinase n=1 Tax=Terribacillus sp. DMT04 TaxID=2850441 RepID=UPI001C2BB4F6|nr:ribokinase [Terribacillus sp. DMT04]QXE02331.1 ribokinase [Terribacillus sp. DMT04]
MTKQVAVIGSLNYDIIVKQQRMPYKGETFIADTLVQGPGGKGANQAAQCAKLGMPTIMVGKVGQDRFGDALVGSLTAIGVDTSYVKRTGSTGLGIVHVMPDGDYYSSIIKGANELITIQDIDEIVGDLMNAAFIILQQEIPQQVTEYIIKRFKDSETQIVLNNAPACHIPSDVLRGVNLLVVNESEAAFMTGKSITTIEEASSAGKKLQEITGDTVIITLGKEGSIAVNNEKNEYFAAKKVKAVDATGAGDSFIGALVYSLSKGQSLDECMKFATEVSAKTVMKEGGQESFPTEKELRKGLVR